MHLVPSILDVQGHQLNKGTRNARTCPFLHYNSMCGASAHPRLLCNTQEALSQLFHRRKPTHRRARVVSKTRDVGAEVENRSAS